MTLAEAVGRNIRRIRRAADMKQEALAYRSGLHRTTISAYENGLRVPTLESFVKLVDGLGVAPGDLLPEEEG